MTISFDNVTPAQCAGNPTTFAHLVCANDDRILLVSILFWDNADTESVTGMTYNGVAMTQVPGCDQRSAVSSMTQDAYYLINPADGNNNVVVTATAPLSGRIEAASWYGVETLDPLGDIQMDLSECNVNITAQVNVASEEGNIVAALSNANHTDCGAAFDVIADNERDESCLNGFYAGIGDSAGVAATTVGTQLNTVLSGRTVFIIGIELNEKAEYLYRDVEYTFSAWDPLQRIIGRDGHVVAPNEVRSDRWGELLGFRSPSSKVFATLADNPDMFYISGVTSDGEQVRIIPDEKLFADMILKRITR